MEAKSVTGMIMGLFVAITVVAVILVPTINDAGVTEETLTNEGLFFMEKYGTDAEFTAVWDASDRTKIVVDGEDVALPSASLFGTMMLVGNNGIYITYSNTGIALYTSEQTGQVLVANNTGQVATTMTITAGSGNISVSAGLSIKTYPITEDFYFISKEGHYVQKGPTDTAYLSGSDSVFFITALLPEPLSIRGTVSGTINDGFTVEGLNYTITSSNHEINCTEVDGYNDLYSFTGVTFDAEYDNGGNTVSSTDLTQKQFVVPYEVTAEKVGPLGEFFTILSVIPLIIIAAIVLGAIGLIATRRD